MTVLLLRFCVQDYSPLVFHYIRKHFHVDDSDYLLSLGGAYEYIEFISNSKSGQFFFYSHDGEHLQLPVGPCWHPRFSSGFISP